jgi:hypothetical protein
MKKALLTLCLSAACMLAATACEKDESSRCPDLVAFTVDCYEQIVGRSPSNDEISQWRDSCETNSHSDACLNCAMQESCADYLQNTQYVYDVICADVCP